MQIHLLFFFIVLTGVAHCDDSQDFDKLHVGILKKVSDCKQIAKNGDSVTVQYEVVHSYTFFSLCIIKGTLKSGELFDKSSDEHPFSFKLGVGQVIQGWFSLYYSFDGY